MSIPQKQLLELLKGCSRAAKKPYPTYQDDLLAAVGEVISAEARHKTVPTNINIKVQDIIEALGDKIRRNTEWSPKTDGPEPGKS